jgi:hypothetical protein
MLSPTLVGQNIDTFIGNARVKEDFPDALAHHLEELKRQSQEAEEDVPTQWCFARTSDPNIPPALGSRG